jgi:hypothetical protein
MEYKNINNDIFPCRVYTRIEFVISLANLLTVNVVEIMFV